MEEKSYDVFRAVADPTRRRIVELLMTAGMLPITAIAADFNSARQVVTKHIYVLEKAGLVSFEESGRERLCRINYQPLKEIFNWVSMYEQFWDKKLTALDKHLQHKQKIKK